MDRVNVQDVVANLTDRQRQTLARLLAGDSEKIAAAHLKVSVHTIHIHVKSLYKYFDVCGRSELLARFIDQRIAHRIASPRERPSVSRLPSRRPAAS